MAVLADIEALTEQGRFLSALESSKELGPLDAWPDARGQVLATRLANHLGSPAIGRLLIRRAKRRWPDDPTVHYYYWAERCNSRRFVRRWLEVRDLELPGKPDRTLRSHWLALKATMLAAMRDHDRAEKLIEKAMHLAPEDEWVHFERGFVLEHADRQAEALLAYQESLRLKPNYRPSVIATATRLHHLNRDEEALGLLKSADAANESGSIRWQLSMLHEESEQYQEAWDLLNDIERYYPLARRHKTRDWLEIIAQRRCDLACSLGRHEEAIQWGSECKGKFYQTITANLKDKKECGNRVRLRVPFVQQSRMTCAPASLAMLCDFFNFPTTHDEIASRICYDGTKAEDERRWAEEAGLIAREFCVTLDSAQRLLDRGFPFALQTVEPGSAHLQVIVGYDSKRGTLLIQDPGSRMLREALAEEFLKQYAPTGPAGLVIAPSTLEEALNAIELPDAALYDHLHRIQRALADHQRESAAAELALLERAAPRHRLTITAQGILARYDGLPLAQLASTESLLEMFPNDEALEISRFSILGLLDRSDKRRQHLEEWIAKGKGGIQTWLRYAGLIESAAESSHREYWLWRILGGHPTNADALEMMAGMYWLDRRRTEAYELYRLAACAEIKQETYARNYFSVCRYIGKAEEGIKYLEARFANFGTHSGLPGLTLARAWIQLDEQLKAKKILDESLALRPEDGELVLGIVSILPSLGELNEASKLLIEHRKHCRPVDWTMANARLLEMSGDSTNALASWRKLADQDSLFVHAHSEVARLLADTQSTEAALEYVRQASDRHPHSRELASLAISWLRAEHRLEEAEQRLGRMLEAHPDDAWAYRDRAIVRTNQNRCDDALTDAWSAIERDPSYVSLQILGFVQTSFGKIKEGRGSLKAALCDSIDSDFAQDTWLRECKTQEERLEALEWIFERIRTERTNGEGLLNWYHSARNDYHPEKMWRRVEKAYEARKDLWQTWSIRLAQMTAMLRHDDAMEFASRYVRRFPLLPIAWVDFAKAAHEADRTDLEISSYQEAIRLSPQWVRPAVALAAAQQADKQLEAAEKTLRRALAIEPRSSELRTQLAKLLEVSNRPNEALEQLAIAASCSPHDDEAWARLTHSSEGIDQGKTARRTARELTESRPEDSRTWIRFSEMLSRPEYRPEAYQALDRAIELKPRNLDAYDLCAQYLASDGLIEEALKKCAPVEFEGFPQPQLIWREALIYESINDLPAAIETLQRLLKFNPSHFSVWSKVADLADAAKLFRDYDEAAAKMIELDPHNPVGYGYQSATFLRQRKRKKAIESLEMALRLDPNYAFAAYELAKLHLEDADFENAQSAVDRAGNQMTELQRAELCCRIALARPVGEEIESNVYQKLNALIDLSDDSPGFLSSAVKMIHKTRKSTLREWVWKTLESGSTSKRAHGRLWVELIYDDFGTSAKFMADKLFRLVDSPGWLGAVETLLERFVNDEEKVQLVVFVNRLKTRIRNHRQLDTSVPYDLLQLNQYQSVQNWCRQWHKDLDRPAKDFLPVTIAYWNSGRVYRALKLVRKISARHEFDRSPILQLWLCVSHLYRGKMEDLAKELGSINTQQLDKWYEWLYQMLAATTIVCRSNSLEEKQSAQELLEIEILRFMATYPDDASRKIGYRCQSICYAQIGQRLKSWYHFYKSCETLLEI